jgi:hypothetical protein
MNVRGSSLVTQGVFFRGVRGSRELPQVQSREGPLLFGYLSCGHASWCWLCSSLSLPLPIQAPQLGSQT